MKNTFTIPIIPENESDRLRALYRYEILDTPPEAAFNNIAKTTAKLFNVPIALISLVDKERVFFKANVGMSGVKNADRGASLCSLAVMSNEVTAFENAKEEPCLLANPLVAGAFGLEFYAGAPLTTSDGYNIGTLCIVDKKNRVFSEKDREMLKDLASIVMDEIEIRLSCLKALEAQSELMHIAAHDLKNPLLNIQALCQLLKTKDDKGSQERMIGLIQDSSIKMVDLITRMVKMTEIESDGFSLDLQPIDTSVLVKEAIKNNQALAAKKNQDFKINIENNSLALIDQHRISEVLDNVIGNAIKYSQSGKTIEVYVNTTEDAFQFSVKDEGLGFSEVDQTKLFKKFTKLSSRPTGGETSSGMGLYIVKKLVDLHGGTVTIESEGKNRGSKVTVTIPQVKKEHLEEKELYGKSF